MVVWLKRNIIVIIERNTIIIRTGACVRTHQPGLRRISELPRTTPVIGGCHLSIWSRKLPCLVEKWIRLDKHIADFSKIQGSLLGWWHHYAHAMQQGDGLLTKLVWIISTGGHLSQPEE